jgi:1,4-dihydroxy-2-naphthoate octaprenyltransferase
MIRTHQLQWSDPKAQAALLSGWLPAEGPDANRRVIARRNLDEKWVLFEEVEGKVSRPGGLAPWFQAIRVFSLTATATPCLAVLVLILTRHLRVDLWIGSSALLGAIALQISTNLFNDVEDYRRLIDLPDTLGGSGAIQNGWWTPRQLRSFAWIALGFGCALGLPALLSSPQALAPIGLAAGLGALLYSGRKLGLKYLALGDAAVWVLCGPALTVGFSLAVSHRSDPGMLWLGSYFGFLAAALLHVNNIQDMHLDVRRGVQTLAIRLGFRRSMRLLVALYISAAISLILPVALKIVPPGALAGALFSLFLSAPWLKEISSALGPESSLLSQCRTKAAQIHLLSGIACVAGLALGSLSF